MQKSSFLALFYLLACSGDDKGSGQDDSGSLSQDDLDADGYSPADGDCDDDNAAVYPGQTEIYCDGVDNDCADGDDDDIDGDGSLCDDDCDDNDATVYPDAEDPCGDGEDSDCGGELECDCDGDDYDGFQCAGSDCNDDNPDINPSAEDVCYDGFDMDCLGNDDYDCDRDGHLPVEHGGDDCDDGNYQINPEEEETCADGVNNDCDEATLDCDCDLDGYEGIDCGGEDCDDANADIGPGADEGTVNNADDDCDELVDEDAYCNVYFPLANGDDALLSYVTMVEDGSTYAEDLTITDWDATTGDATISRSLTSALYSWAIDESWSCVDGTISMSGLALNTSGIPLFTASYSEAHVVLLPEAELVADATWSYGYTATDAALGTLWTVEGTMTVVGTETVEVTAGTFDALVVDADYVLDVPGASGPETRKGSTTYYFVPKIGIVYALDITEEGITAGERELTAYSGFYP